MKRLVLWLEWVIVLANWSIFIIIAIIISKSRKELDNFIA